MKIKYLFIIKTYLLLFLLNCFEANAQHLSLFNVNTSKYPVLSGDFYAFNNQAEQIITLTKNQVSIEENSISQRIIKVTNPKRVEPKPLSLVLTVDVSGSMEGKNMSAAKLAAKKMVKLLSFEHSECALTSFDNRNFVNSDFTKDPSRIEKAIDNLVHMGGTDYNQAFNHPLTGAFEIVKKGQHKKVIIFLTDGLGDADQSAILKKAMSTGAIVYCITLNMSAPDVLKEVATKTKGKYFENVRVGDDVTRIYEQILFEAQELDPSTVVWESSPSCTYFQEISFKTELTPKTFEGISYQKPNSGAIELKSDREGVTFEDVKLGKSYQKTLVLKAINADFTITAVESTNPAFSCDENTPFTIKKGEQRKITI